MAGSAPGQALSCRPMSRAGVGWAESREIVVSALAPGLPTLRRNRPLGVGLLVLGVLGPLIWLVVDVIRHHSWVALGLDRGFLGRALVALIVMLVARVAAVGEVLASDRRRSGFGARALVATAVLVAVGLPTVVVAGSVVESAARHRTSVPTRQCRTHLRRSRTAGHTTHGYDYSVRIGRLDVADCIVRGRTAHAADRRPGDRRHHDSGAPFQTCTPRFRRRSGQVGRRQHDPPARRRRRSGAERAAHRLDDPGVDPSAQRSGRR